MTAEEFLHEPEPPDGGRWELVEGRVVTMPPVSGGHGRRASRIDRLLGTFVEQHALGEVLVEAGYVFARNPDSVRGPDVSFVANDRIPEGGIPDEGWVPCIPTLAVEVVSPDDLDREVQRKVDLYLAAGVARVWVVRPKNRTITVCRPGGDAHVFGRDESLGSDDAGFAVEGFQLPLRQIFD
jgi:Uma2 family endonuclease